MYLITSMKTLSFSFLLLAFPLIVPGDLQNNKVDKTLTPGANGVDVVDACIQKIESVFSAFGHDFGFMKRLAFVESEFGIDQEVMESNPTGGIWQITDHIYDEIQTNNNTEVFLKRAEVFFGERGFDLTNKNFRNLFLSTELMSVPLRSAFAARLYVTLLAGSFQIPNSLEAQATWWSQLYNPGAPKSEFRQLMQDYENRHRCFLDKIDLGFLLDGSENIGIGNFRLSLDFFVKVVNDAAGSGTSQHTLKGFSSSDSAYLYVVRITEPVDDEMFDAVINETLFPTASTENVVPMSAVELLKTKFLADSGPSLSDVPRILTVLTDGKDIEDLRGAIREAKQSGVVVFVIGVGQDYDNVEISHLASSSLYAYYFPGFIDLTSVIFDTIVPQICTVPLIIQNGSRIVVDILPGQAHFFQASLSASKSLQLQFEIEDAKEGTTYLSSSVQNPNSAIHDIACKIKGNSSITVNSSKEGQLSFGHARRTRSLQSSNVMKRIYFSHVSTNNSRYKLVVTAIENELSENGGNGSERLLYSFVTAFVAFTTYLLLTS